MIVAEQILLLGLDDESGKVSGFSAPYLNYAIAGASITDLLLQKKITVELNNQEEEIIRFTDQKPLENDFLQKVFILLLAYEKELTLDHCVNLLVRNYGHLREKLFSNLVKQEILERIEKKRLKIFKYVRHPLKKPELKEDLLYKIQEVILENKPPNDQIASLLALVGATNMVGTVFSKENRKMATTKIKEYTESSIIGSEIKSLIQTLQATMTSIILASSVIT